MMPRKTTCAVAGVALACAAALSLSVIARSEAVTNLDLRWLHMSSQKEDRLPVRASANEDAVLSFDLSSQSMTIATRVRPRPLVESAVRALRPASVRTIPVQPVREVPNESEVRKERLPEGCEPAFSPVTNPAYAHIGVRCDS
jgi:hypothetical protein